MVARPARRIRAIIYRLCGCRANNSEFDRGLSRAYKSPTATTATGSDEKRSLWRSTRQADTNIRGRSRLDDAQEASSDEAVVQVPTAAIRELKESVDRLRASHDDLSTHWQSSARAAGSASCSLLASHGLCKQCSKLWKHIPAGWHPLPQELERVMLVGQEHVRYLDKFFESPAIAAALFDRNHTDPAIMPDISRIANETLPMIVSSGANSSQQQVHCSPSDDNIEDRVRQILDSTPEDDLEKPGLLDRYYTAAQDANLLKDQLLFFEADYAEALDARSLLLEQDNQAAVSDDDFELHWQREREQLTDEIADKQAIAERLKQQCLDEGLVISIYRDRRGDNEPTDSISILTDDLHDYLPAGIEVEHLTCDRYMNVTPPPDERLGDLIFGWLGSSQGEAASPEPVDSAGS